MPVVYLTDVVVSRLKEPGTYFDEITPAFGIRVGKNRKTWIVIRGRERVRTRIGRYPAVSLAKARKQALVLLGSPIEPKVEVPKFADAVQQFYAIHVPTMKPKTQYQIKRVINKYFAKPLQHKRLDEVTHHDITKVTDELAKRVPGEAFHVFKYIRIFLRWCVPRYIKHSPMEGLKSPTKYVPRKRVLSKVEIVEVWKAAETVGYPFGTAIQLSLLWGTRWGEMISCRRAFIDTEERTITLPETKNGTQHCFPYGNLTADILEIIPRFNSTDLLFPGRDMVSPWNGSGKAKWELMRTTPEFILNQRPYHFAAYVRGLTDSAVSLGIPAIDMNAAPRMSEEERRLVRQGIRDKYAVSVAVVQRAAPLQTQPSVPPVDADSNVETDAAAKEW